MPTIDHHATGQQLYAIRDQLLSLSLPYPKTSKAQRALTKAIRAIDHLRCELDEQYATEAPQSFDTRAYYPGSQYAAPGSGSR